MKEKTLKNTLLKVKMIEMKIDSMKTNKEHIFKLEAFNRSFYKHLKSQKIIKFLFLTCFSTAIVTAFFHFSKLNYNFDTLFLSSFLAAIFLIFYSFSVCEINAIKTKILKYKSKIDFEYKEMYLNDIIKKMRSDYNNDIRLLKSEDYKLTKDEFQNIVNDDFYFNNFIKSEHLNLFKEDIECFIKKMK